jgi:long-subunit acyl-CoA synthetase (AMP-forming)
MFLHGDGDNIQIFQRQSLLQQRYWIYSALVNGHDITISSPEDVLAIAQSAHPTVVMGVPVFFADLKRQLESSADYGPGELARRRAAIQATLGGRIRYLWTGSAPASRASLDYFNECGVPLYEGYGLNETCIIAKNCPGAYRIGSVGKVLPNKTVRIDSDGMLVVRSRSPVALQYLWCSPGDNERMFLPSGEVKTQDLGYFDSENYLYILGRVDELIALSCGRKVIVRPIEESLKLHPAVHECVLYGIGRPFLTALISPASETMDTVSLSEHVNSMNAKLRREQQILIGGVVIAGEQFSIDNGLLTTQSKPIRKRIYARLDSEIEAIYEKRALTQTGEAKLPVMLANNRQ